MDPPFKTASEQSELFAVLRGQWYPIQNGQLIRKYQCNGRYIETNAHIDTKVSFTPQTLLHVVTNTKFEMKYPHRFLLTSSGQEWQLYIAIDM